MRIKFDASKFARSGQWFLLLFSIGLLAWNISDMASASAQAANHHNYPANIAISLTLIGSCLTGLTNKLPLKIAFLAAQCLSLLFAFRYLVG